MIYFDNAATTLVKPRAVAEKVYQSIFQLGNSGRGANGSSLNASRIVYEARENVARLFGCGDPSQVAFTSNATESLNTAIMGLIHPGEHVITTVLEHNSVLRPLYRLEEQGVELSIVPFRENGRFEADDLEGYIRPNTQAIVCTHASNLTGDKINIRRVGEICRMHGLYFILDASQTAGVFPIDMKDDAVSVLCFTGHKSLFGPQGTGGLCVKKGVRIQPFKVGGSGIMTFSKTHPAAMPEALEAGTLNAHGISGLNEGVKYVLENGVSEIHRKQTRLMKKFYEGIYTLPGITVYGNFLADDRAPIVTFNIAGYDSGQVSDELAQRFEIYGRSGGHCAPLMHEALGTKKQGAVRFSFSHFNTEAEVLLAIRAIKQMIEENVQL